MTVLDEMNEALNKALRIVTLNGGLLTAAEQTEYVKLANKIASQVKTNIDNGNVYPVDKYGNPLEC